MLSIGRIVHYTLNQSDADQINKRRAVALEAARNAGAAVLADGGNSAAEGDTYPAIAVRIFGGAPASYANLQVFLDGNDSYWATSRPEGDKPGTWSWPPLEFEGE